MRKRKRQADKQDTKHEVAAPDSKQTDIPASKGRGVQLVFRAGLWGLLLLALAAAYPAWVRFAQWKEFDNARKLVDRWDLVRGVRAAQVYQAKNKRSPHAAWLLARGLRRSEKLDEAEKELQNADRLGYPTREIEIERLMIEAARGKVENLEDRVDSFDSPLPDYYLSDSCASLASGYAKLFNWRQAIKWLDQWSRFETDQPEPLARIGDIYWRATDYDSARSAYQRVLKRWPRNRHANLALGDDMVTNKNYRGALEKFRIVVEDDPASASVWRKISETHLRLGEIDEAAEAAETMRPLTYKSAELETDLLQLDLIIGLRRAEQNKDKSEGIRLANEFEVYLESRPGDLTAQFEYARALKLADRLDQAEEQQAKHLTMLRAREKVDDLMPTIMNDPDNVDLRVEASRLLIEAGEANAAQTILKSVIFRDPDRQDAVDIMVSLYQKSPDPGVKKLANELRAAVEEARKLKASTHKGVKEKEPASN